LLFAVALIGANKPFLLATILPVAPAVLAAIHSRSLGDGGRRPVGDNGDDSEQQRLAREHVIGPSPKVRQLLRIRRLTFGDN
jgi:hypothetical protein